MGITTRKTPARDWKDGLPWLYGARVTLRELEACDALALLTALTTEQVSRFISPPPSTVHGFERFIAWTAAERAEGRFICFGVVPARSKEPIGLFQVRPLLPGFETAEWGFAICHERWGSGVFADAAPLIVDFAFDVLGAQRLEARAALPNARGNGALQKIGAFREGVLRKAFFCRGEQFDQVLWTICRDQWRQAKPRGARRPGTRHGAGSRGAAVIRRRA